jgi:CRISPR/Cas system-associated exonuclease Cas4 (RecB family)
MSESYALSPKSFDDLPDIVEAWRTLKSKKIKQHPQNCLRASSIGNGCDRYHYYSIKNWRDRVMHGPETQAIFDEGFLHEEATIKDLKEMGFEIVEQQRACQLDKPLITGHIDGIMLWENQRFPFDVKSIADYDFHKINSAEDLLYSKKAHQRSYPAQLQIYLLQHEEETGCFILKNKQTGAIKAIWMQMDYDFIETILKRAERVYAAIEKEAIPNRTDDESWCRYCAFKQLCLPPSSFGDGVKPIDDLELAGLLERREQLAPLSKEFNEVDKTIKSFFDKEGEYLCADYLIKSQKINVKRKIATEWDEIETSYIKNKIIKLEGKQNGNNVK